MHRSRTLHTLAITLGLCASLVVRGAPPDEAALSGKIIGVTDGDTVTLLDATKNQYKIRLEGIDAPEQSQAFGTQARKSLSERVFGEQVSVVVKGQDKYGRTLGHIYIGDRWINLELVESGFAWHYKKYSSDSQLAKAEVDARQSKSGLWRDARPVAPWDYRKNPSGDSKSEAPEPTDTVFVTKSGTKYHRQGCRFLAKSKSPLSLKDAKAAYAPCSVCKPPQ